MFSLEGYRLHYREKKNTNYDRNNCLVIILVSVYGCIVFPKHKNLYENRFVIQCLSLYQVTIIPHM